MLTRRQRKLWVTAAFGIAFVALAGVVAWRMLGRGDAYSPGGSMEGLTSDLTRPLPADHPRVTFSDVTQAAGITYRNFSGTRTSQLPEDMGSGAAWGDFDDDGWVDLAIANAVGPVSMTEAGRRASPARTSLYRNNRDGTFTDVTDEAGIGFRGWGMAASWGDYDNDGRLDLLITAYGHNVLYHNEGGGRFSDRSIATGVGVPEGFWTGAAWGDYDRDGFLDLYVTGYVKYSQQPNAGAPGIIEVENPASINPSSFPGERNLLFHNTRRGAFTERAVAAGVDNPTGRGLAASWVDLDDDGWVDLYVGNDVSDNLLYRNRRDGTFEDISHASRIADYRSSMGIAVGDWNGDGRQDLFLTHWLAQGNALYDNVPPLGPRTAKSSPVIFVDESDRYGLGQVSLDFIGWGTSFIDYDLDGKLDLFVVNGSTLQSRNDPTQLVPMRSQLFWNRGPDEGFFEVSPVSGDFFRLLTVGRGAAFADFDNDGDVDGIVTVNGGPAHLLRNDGGNQNHWLQVELRGSKSTRQAIGARVRLVAGGTSQSRHVGAQASYLSQNSLIETFGLGSGALVDTLEIIWPGGAREVRTGLSANQRVRVVEGEVSAVSDRAGLDRFWALMRDATSQRIDGQYAQALATYQRALALNPRHGDALYYTGSMQLELGAYADAAASWRRQIVADPSSARALSQMGALFLCIAPGAVVKPDSAEAYFQRAHDINKEETGPLLRLAEVALVRGNLAQAQRLIETVLSTHAESAPAHFYGGYLALRHGDAASAAREFARAQALPVAAAVAGATNEGDTKTGEAMRARSQRCGALRTLSEERASTDAQRSMRNSYRRLDSLLTAARAQVR
ncbi:MAG: FG-GAP-like repeat-containing protein [Gemmatimonadota bacterium]